VFLHHALLAALDSATHQAYITTGGAIIIAILSAVLPVLLGQNWLNGRRTKRAAESSAKAAAQTAKTGNGFALRTEEALARIERALESQGGQIITLTNRFNNHIDKDDTP
jgi:type II secretory pathway pseudopilin PulG